MIARIDAMAAGKNREAVSTGKISEGKGRDCEREARAVAGSFATGWRRWRWRGEEGEAGVRA